MVAIISGNGAGLSNSSAATLDQQGIFGQKSIGNTKETGYVNVANGNFILQDKDGFRVSEGIDLSLTRTYNSQGNFSDGNGLQWKLGILKEVKGLHGTVNAVGSTVVRIDGDGSYTVFTYDADRKAYIATDGGGAYQSITYDSENRKWYWRPDTLISEKVGEFAPGLVETYDEANGGRILGASDGAKGRTKLTYTYLGSQLSQVVDATGDRVIFQFANGNLTEIRQGNESLVTYFYDLQNRLIKVSTDLTPDNSTDSKAFTISYTYDGNSNRINSVKNSDGNEILIGYSQKNADSPWQVSSITNGSQVINFDYSVLGKTTVTQANTETTYVYDDLGQLTQVDVLERADNGGVSVLQSTFYGYDDKGNIKYVQSGRGVKDHYYYDNNGNRIKENHADGSIVEREYDLATNKLLSETKYAGLDIMSGPQKTRYLYDENLRLSLKLSPENRVTQYVYDDADHLTSIITYTDSISGGLVAVDDIRAALRDLYGSRIDYSYDIRGLIYKETRYANVYKDGVGVAGQNTVLRYVYDREGNLLQSIDGRGRTTAYSYDVLGRQLTKTAPNGAQTVTAYAGASVVDGGPGGIVTVTEANGMSRSVYFDKDGSVKLRKLTSNNTLIYSENYYYDANGNLTYVYKQNAGNKVIIYDAAGRVKFEVETASTFDVIQNNAYVKEYFYNADNQVISSIKYAKTIEFRDALSFSGDLERIRPAKDDKDQQSWNIYNKSGALIQHIDEEGYVTSYFYDGLSQPVKEIHFASKLNSVDALESERFDRISVAPSINDRVTRRYYDKDNNLIGVVDAAGYLTEFSYNGAGLLIKKISYATQVKDFAKIDSKNLNELRPSTSELDIRERYFYDGRNLLVAVLDAENYLTTKDYDSNGNLSTQVRFSVKVVDKSDTEPLNNILGSISPIGRQVTRYFYNNLNQIWAISQSDGSITMYSYDSMGRLISTRETFGEIQINGHSDGTLIGGEGNDFLFGGDGNNIIDGRGGNDVVGFKGKLSDYVISKQGNTVIVTGNGSIDTLTNISVLRFADQDYVLQWNGNEVTADDRSTIRRYDVQGNLIAQLSGIGAEKLLEISNASMQDKEKVWSKYATKYIYDAENLMTSRTDANGRRTVYFYDAQNRLTHIINAMGEVSENIYQSYSQPAQIRQYAKRLPTNTLANLAGGRVTKELKEILSNNVDDKDAITSKLYDNRGQLIENTDALGGVVKNAYNAFGELISSGRKKSTAEVNLLLPTKYEYDVRGNLTSESVKYSSYTSNNIKEYDAFGRIISSTDANNKTKIFSYDRLGNLISESNANSSVSSLAEYDAFGRVVSRTDQKGNGKVYYSYNPIEHTFTVTDSENVQHTTRLNRFGQTLTLNVGESAEEVNYTYDLDGNLLKVADAKGVQKEYEYDNSGMKKIARDGNGTVTEFQYDSVNRVTSINVDPSGLNLRTWYSYDSAGRVLTITDPRGLVTENSYDILGRLIEVKQDKNGQAASTKYEYDVFGEIYRKTDANGKVTQFWRSEANLVTVDTIDLGGTSIVTRRDRDPAGNVVLLMEGKVVNGAEIYQSVTRYAYNADNQLIYELDADGSVTKHEYDADKRLVSTTHFAAKSNLVSAPTFLENNIFSANQIAASIDKSPKADVTTRIVYDRAGRVYATIDGKGMLTVNLNFDKEGRVLRRVSYANAVNTASLNTILSIAEINAQMKDEKFVDPAHDQQKVFRYDVRGNVIASLTALTKKVGEVQQWSVQSFAYDKDGNLTSQKNFAKAMAGDTPSDATIEAWIKESGSIADNESRMIYDNANRLTATLRSMGGNTWSLVRQEYNRNGDISDRHSYSNAIQLTASQLSNAVVLQTEINRFSASNIQDKDIWQKYTYDTMNRLVATATSLGKIGDSIKWQITRQEYDGVGNLIARTVYAEPTATENTPVPNSARDQLTRYAYNGANLLTTVVDANGKFTQYAYDEMGNRIRTTVFANSYTNTGKLNAQSAPASTSNDQVTRTAYDAEHRPVIVVDAVGNVTEQKYDSLGRAWMSIRYAKPIPANKLSSLGQSPTRADILAQFDTSLSTAQIERRVFDQDNRVRFVLDAEGYIKEYKYDALGQMTESRAYQTKTVIATDVDSQALAITLGELGTQVSLDADIVDAYSYDSYGNLLTHTDALGGIQSYSYDGLGNRLSYKDKQGNIWIYEYNSSGQRTKETSPPVYLGGGQGTKSIITTYAYSVLGDLIERIEGQGSGDTSERRTIYSYDLAHNLLATASTIRLANNQYEWKVTKNVRDVFGNVLMQTEFASKMITAKQYDSVASLASFLTLGSKPAEDKQTNFAYDKLNRMTMQVSRGQYLNGKVRSSVMRQEYDVFGNIISRTEYGSWLSDSLAMPEPTASNYADSVIAAMTPIASIDRVSSFAYDKNSRLVIAMDAKGGVTKFTYDAFGNQIKIAKYATADSTAKKPLSADYQPKEAPLLDRVTRQIFDKYGRITLRLDAAGYATKYSYDAQGNRWKTTQYAEPLDISKLGEQPTLTDVPLVDDNANDRSQYAYFNKLGLQRFAVDGLGYITEYVYDQLGHLGETYQFSGKYSLSLSENSIGSLLTEARNQKNSITTIKTISNYNLMGNLVKLTDALGAIELYTYDALGRKLSFTNKLNQTWNYAYDLSGNLIEEKTPLVKVYDQSGAGTTRNLYTTFTYDTFGQITSRTELSGESNGRTTSYEYDLAGHQVKTIYPRVGIYSYRDASGLDAEATNGASGDAQRRETVPDEILSSVIYDALGNAITNTDVGGNKSYKNYDILGRVQFEVDAEGYATGYMRNAFGETIYLIRFAEKHPSFKPGGTGIDPNIGIDIGLLKASTSDRAITYRYDKNGRKTHALQEQAFVIDENTSIANNTYLRKTNEWCYNAFGDTVASLIYGADDQGNVVGNTQGRYNFYNLRGAEIGQIEIARIDAQRQYGYVTTKNYDAVGNLLAETEYAKEILIQSQGTVFNLPGSDVTDRGTSYEYDLLNRQTSKTSFGATYFSADEKNIKTRDESTITTYDMLGNITSETDALNKTTFNYYDELGRKIGTAVSHPAGSSAKTSASKMYHDAYGNLVRQVEYAKGAKIATLSQFEVEEDNPNDRVETNKFDLNGHKIEATDANRKSLYTSYNVFGKVAKVWKTVSNGVSKQTSFTITQYDKLGNEILVGEPNVTGAGLLNITKSLKKTISTFNAFGEVTEKRIDYSNNPPAGHSSNEVIELNEFDKVGRLWRSNATDGTDMVYLYDAFGNRTVEIRSVDSQNSAGLRTISRAEDALPLKNIMRTNKRYDLLGHMTDSQISDQALYFLKKDALSQWVKVRLGSEENAANSTAVETILDPGNFLGNSMLAIADAEDRKKGLDVKIRLKGATEWRDGNAYTVNLGDYVGLNTLNMPSGNYEYLVKVKGASGAVFDKETGTFEVQQLSSYKKNIKIIELYSAILNRAPDGNALSYWTDRLNSGASFADIAEGLLNSAEGKARFSNGPAEAIKKIFSESFGRVSDDLYVGDSEKWTYLYGNAIAPASTTTRGQVILDLIEDVRLTWSKDVAARSSAYNLLNDRVTVISDYLVTHQGTNEDRARTDAIYQKVTSDFSGAKADARNLANTQLPRKQVFSLYMAMFGIAPTKTQLTDGVTRLNQLGGSYDAYANEMMRGSFATAVEYYPSAGLTDAQIKNQLVNRAYQYALNRAPTADELSQWLARLNGIPASNGNPAVPAIGTGKFFTEFVETLSYYNGIDSISRKERLSFDERVSFGLKFVEGDLGDTASVGLILSTMNAIVMESNEYLSSEAIINAVKAKFNSLATIENALIKAGDAQPLEELSLKLASFYTTIFNRVPDKIGFNFHLDNLKVKLKQNGSISTSIWDEVARRIFDSAEFKSISSLGSAVSNRNFVQEIYRRAFGEVPTSDAAQVEISKFVQLIDNGAARSVVMNQMLDQMLGFDNLSAADTALKAKFYQNSATGLALVSYFPIDNKLANPGDLVSIWNTVKSGQIKIALDTVFNKTFSNLAQLSSMADSFKNAYFTDIVNSTKILDDPSIENSDAYRRMRVFQLLFAIHGNNYSLTVNDFEDFQYIIDNKFSDIAIVNRLMQGAGRSSGILMLSNNKFIETIFNNILGESGAAYFSTEIAEKKASMSSGGSKNQMLIDIFELITNYWKTPSDGILNNKLHAKKEFYEKLDFFISRSISASPDQINISNLKELIKYEKPEYVDPSPSATVSELKASANSQRAIFEQKKIAQFVPEDVSKTSQPLAYDGMADYQIMRLYVALFKRDTKPSYSELQFWLEQYNKLPKSEAFSGIAQAFLDSLEGKGLYPASNNTEFVNKLYINILGRARENNDVYWVNQLNDHAGASNIRGKIVVGIMNGYFNDFSDSLPEQIIRKFNLDKKIFSFFDALYDENRGDPLLYAKSYAIGTKEADVNYIKYLLINNAYQNARVASVKIGFTDARNIALAIRIGSADLYGLQSSEYKTSDEGNVLKIGKLFLAIFGRGPTLSEAILYLDKIGKGNYSEIDLANDIIANDRMLTGGNDVSDDVFISRIYSRVFGRVADSGGMAYWKNVLITSTDPTNARAKIIFDFYSSVYAKVNTDTIKYAQKMAGVLQTIHDNAIWKLQLHHLLEDRVFDIENQAKDYDLPSSIANNAMAKNIVEISKLYLGVFGRIPDLDGVIFWLDKMNRGASLQEIAKGMLNSEEFKSLPTETDAMFVSNFLSRVLLRTVTSAEGLFFENRIINGDRSDAVLKMIDMASKGGIARNTYISYDLNAILENLEVLPSQLQFNGRVNDALSALVRNEQKISGGIKKATGGLNAANYTNSASFAIKSTQNAVTAGSRISGVNQMTYDRWGNVISIKDARDPSWETKYTYNANNQIISVESPLSSSSKPKYLSIKEYDALGRTIATVDGNGNVNKTIYSLANNTVTEKQADGGEKVSTYDLFGQRISLLSAKMEDGRRVLTNYAYDHLGNLTSITKGNPVDVWKANDAAGRPGDMSAVPNGSAKELKDRFEYDELGRMVRSIDASGVAITQEFDLDDNLIKVTKLKNSGYFDGANSQNAALSIEQFSYDAFHHKIWSQDANGAQMTWQYNAAGRMVSHTDMSGKRTNYAYDNAGQMLRKFTASNAASNTPVDNEQNLHYQYQNGLLTSITDLSLNTTTSYRYDKAGNRVSERVDVKVLLPGKKGDGSRDTETAPIVTNDGQKATAFPSDEPDFYQYKTLLDNTISYDALNRITRVVDRRDSALSRKPNADRKLYMEITFDYDDNGNRTKVTNTYYNADGTIDAAASKIVFNKYDEMNRQTVFNAVDANYSLGSYGHSVTYDKMGNRTSDSWNGKRMVKDSLQNVKVDANLNDLAYATEYYSYDAIGRLQTTNRDHILDIDTRLYDANSRVIRSGMAYDEWTKVNGSWPMANVILDEVGVKTNQTTVSYFAGGQQHRQVVRNAFNGGEISKTYFIYDNVGNLKWYGTPDTPDVADHKNSMEISYHWGDSYEIQEEKAWRDGVYNSSYSYYDVNGDRYQVKSGSESKVRAYYDSEGHILYKHMENSQDEETILVNGELLGFMDKKPEGKVLGSDFVGASSLSQSSGVSSYTVQSDGETLRGIAKAVWGDSSLWYVLAEANGLGADETLTKGKILRIPPRGTEVHNDYSTFKPYSASEAIGDTTPAPPAPDSCGTAGIILMIVVMVAVTLATAGSMAAASSSAFQGMNAFQAGMSFYSTMGAAASGLGIGFATQVGIAATAAAAGSIASQAIGVAIDAQESFSWKGVALAALSSVVQVGVSMGPLGGGGWEKMAVRAMVSNAITQGIAVMTPLQERFDWRGVAAAGAASVASSAVSSALKLNSISNPLGRLAANTASNFAGGVVSAAVRGGKMEYRNIAADAFGNALGSSLGDLVSNRTSRPGMREVDVSPTGGSTGGSTDDILQRLAAMPLPDVLVAGSGADTDFGNARRQLANGRIVRPSVHVQMVSDQGASNGYENMPSSIVAPINEYGNPILGANEGGYPFNPNRAIHTPYVALDLPEGLNSDPALGPVRISYSEGRGFLRYPQTDGSTKIFSAPEGYDIPSLPAYQAGGLARGFVNAGIDTAKMIGNGWSGLGYLATGNFNSYNPMVKNLTLENATTALGMSVLGILTEMNPSTGDPERAGANLFGALSTVGGSPATGILKQAPVFGANVKTLAQTGARTFAAGTMSALANWGDKFGFNLFPTLSVVPDVKGVFAGNMADVASDAGKAFMGELSRVPGGAKVTNGLSYVDKLVLAGDATRARIVQEIGEAAQPSLEAIWKLDPDAKIGFRGSLANGVKNAEKLGSNGERVAFDGTVATKGGAPYKGVQGYDADFFVVSDKLASKFGRNEFFKNIADLRPGLKSTFADFGNSMKNNPVFSGMKHEIPTFRVFAEKQITKKLEAGDAQIYFIKQGG